MHGKDADDTQQATSKKDLDSALDDLQGILERRHVVPNQPPAEPEEDDWAEEIKRLRAARGERLVDRLNEDSEKDPPVD